MIACACKCGEQCDVPDNLAGLLLECPACGSTLLVPPTTRPIRARGSWAKKVRFVLARLLLCAGIGVATGTFYWELFALHGEAGDGLPALRALLLLGGTVGGGVGLLLYGLEALVPPESTPPALPLPFPSTQRPGSGRTEVTRTPKAPDA